MNADRRCCHPGDAMTARALSTPYNIVHQQQITFTSHHHHLPTSYQYHHHHSHHRYTTIDIITPEYSEHHHMANYPPTGVTFFAARCALLSNRYYNARGGCHNQHYAPFARYRLSRRTEQTIISYAVDITQREPGGAIRTRALLRRAPLLYQNTFLFPTRHMRARARRAKAYARRERYGANEYGRYTDEYHHHHKRRSVSRIPSPSS